MATSIGTGYGQVSFTTVINEKSGRTLTEAVDDLIESKIPFDLFHDEDTLFDRKSEAASKIYHGWGGLTVGEIIALWYYLQLESIENRYDEERGKIARDLDVDTWDAEAKKARRRYQSRKRALRRKVGLDS